MNRIIMLVILYTSILLTGCKEDSNPVVTYPELVFRDTIPFYLLQKGIICFNRTSADLNSSGLCIIDNNNLRTKAISGYFYQPTISPDGAKIAYSSFIDFDKFVFDVFIMNSDGSELNDISKMAGSEKYPSWSSESNNLFYLNYYGQWTTLYNIYKNPVYKTSTTKPLTPFSFFESKGMIFYDSATEENPAIILLDPINNRIETVCTAAGKGYIYTPRWSPDGNFIAFAQVKLGNIGFNGGSIQVYNTNTSELKIIYEWNCDIHRTFVPADNDLSVCWSPDGTKLAFNKIGSGFESHIYLINADGSNLKQITSEPGVSDRSVSWSAK